MVKVIRSIQDFQRSCSSTQRLVGLMVIPFNTQIVFALLGACTIHNVTIGHICHPLSVSSTMCLKTHRHHACSHADSVEILSATVPVTCMRSPSFDSRSPVICMYTATPVFCDPADLTENIGNDFLPPLSSSPSQITSSPHSVSTFSNEESSSEKLTSSFNTSSLPARNWARNADDFSHCVKDLELPFLDRGLLESRSVCAPSRTFCLSRASPINSALRTGDDSSVLDRSCSYLSITSLAGSPDESSTGLCANLSSKNNDPLDINLFVFEPMKELTRTASVPSPDGGLTSSPGSVVKISPIAFSSNSENRNL